MRKQHSVYKDIDVITESINLINEATQNFYEERDVSISSDTDAFIVSVDHFSFGGIPMNLSLVFEGYNEYDAEKSLSIEAGFSQKNRSGAELVFSIDTLEAIGLDFNDPLKSLKPKKKKILKHIREVEVLYSLIENKTDEVMGFVNDLVVNFFSKSKAIEGTVFRIKVTKKSVDFEAELPNDDFFGAEIQPNRRTIKMETPDGIKSVSLNNRNLNELLKIISR